MKLLEKLRYKEISRLFIKNYPDGTNRSIRSRAHNGFVFCKKGSAIYSYEGRDYLCDETHVILVSKKTDYDFVTNGQCEMFTIDFELSEGQFEGLYLLSIGESSSFYRGFQDMQNRIFSLSSYKLPNLSSLYDLTSRINDFGFNKKKYEIIEESERYMEDNRYSGGLSIDDIAEKSNISEVYFRRLFKEKYGISPVQYINNRRIKLAKDLLVKDEMTINEISQVCGFSDLYSFSRAFKKKVGTAPSQYKKSMQFRNC